MRQIVNVGDGRFVEMPKEGPKASPKAPKKPDRKPPSKNMKTGAVKKRTLHHTPAGKETPSEVPGRAEWIEMRRKQTDPFRTAEFRKLIGAPLFSRFGIPGGMQRSEAEVVWARARERAKKDIQNMKDAGVLDLNDTRAEEALETTLTVMRSPMNQQTQLAAARQVLEWTKAKPAAKTEMTVNAAEAWLSEIAKEAEGDA